MAEPTLEDLILRLRRLGYPRLELFGLGGGYGGVTCRIRGGQGEELVINRATDRAVVQALLRAVEAMEVSRQWQLAWK